MNRHAAPEKKDSLRLFYIFCIVVLLLITGSLLLKAVHTIRESKFDPGHSFILTFLTRDGAVIYPIDPEKKEFSAVRVSNTTQELSVSRDLHIPQSAEVRLSSVDTDSLRLKPLFPKLFFQKSDLTWYDLTRLMITTSAMSEDSDNETKIDFREIDDSLTFDSTFYDQEIVREKATVGIVNAAGVSGVGGRLEQMLSNLGVSVISVTTAQKPVDRSEIQFIDQTFYTLKKLHTILGFPMMETQDLTTSDILIIIGKDMSETDLF